MAEKFKSEHDMNDDNYDYVVLGTNLSENILGAALGINKEKCLFLDFASNAYDTLLFNLVQLS